ncbi:hypothetical protein B0H19DRAFT_1065984 [Mycena capillaripes]|nr:hypothetical protein B0H19DRAFT_1065984 [Mycena capillaripes]
MSSPPDSTSSADILPESLTSLEFRAMIGQMDHQLLRRIGSLPHLRALTTDPRCFAGLNGIEGSTPFRAEQDSRSSLLMKLTHLKLEGKTKRDVSPPTLFGSILDFIGANNLQALILGVLGLSFRTRLLQGGAARGRGRGRGGAALGGVDEVPRDILPVIAHRWSQSLRQLELDVDGNPTVVINLLGRLSALHSLKLSGFLEVPHGVGFCSAFTGLASLETLSLYSRWGSNRHLLFDIPSIARLAVLCPKLRELYIAFSESKLEDWISLSWGPISRPHPP